MNISIEMAVDVIENEGFKLTRDDLLNINENEVPMFLECPDHDIACEFCHFKEYNGSIEDYDCGLSSVLTKKEYNILKEIIPEEMI